MVLCANQRRIEAKIAGDDGRSNEFIEVLFVLKQVLMCMDQSNGGLPTVGGVNEGSTYADKKTSCAEEGSARHNLRTKGEVSGHPQQEGKQGALDTKVDDIDKRVAKIGEQVEVYLCGLRTMRRWVICGPAHGNASP